MNIEELRDFCLGMHGATEDFPFDEVTLVFKVQGKMFALIPLDIPEPQITLKCDPERVIALREEYSAIVPARYFNKKYWNTVMVDPLITRDMLQELIRHSYELVVAGLPKKLRDELMDMLT